MSVIDSPNPAKSYVDVAFIVPLLEEFRRLEALFPALREEVSGDLFWKHLDVGNPDVSAVAILQDDMGKSAAVRAAETLLNRFDVGVIIIVGIAGGLSGDAAIGDVCFTGDVIDVLENAKVSDGPNGKTRMEFNSQFYSTDHLLTFALRYTQLGADIKSNFEDWQLRRHYDAKDLIPGEFIGRGDKNEVVGLPQIHDGSIVCGAVSKSDVYKSNLRSIERKVLALETESGGVFHSAQIARVPAITIRGICDYADRNKNKLEEQTGGNTRHIAANNAITFAALQFKNPQFLMYLLGRRDQYQRSATPLLDIPSPDELTGALRTVSETVHEQLTQLSPHYHGKPVGYRLPLPRVRPAPASATVTPAMRKTDPLNLLEAIASHRICVVSVPRSYPDNSLPWVVASDLCRIEIDGKRAVPVVIPGDAIKPPHNGLAQHS